MIPCFFFYTERDLTLLKRNTLNQPFFKCAVACPSKLSSVCSKGLEGGRDRWKTPPKWLQEIRDLHPVLGTWELRKALSLSSCGSDLK